MDDIPELKAEKMVHSLLSSWHCCRYLILDLLFNLLFDLLFHFAM